MPFSNFNMNDIDHLAIRGTSFCGSTIISYALGLLPSCANIGESHWLQSDSSFGCLRCGEECLVINAELRSRLNESEVDWYPTLRRSLNANVLISSDKHPEILARLDPLGKRSELIVFKNPLENLLSYINVTHETLDECAENYFATWFRVYSEKYEHCVPVLGYLFLNDFLDDPYRIISAIANLLGVDFQNNLININNWWLHPHHAVGGNFNPFDDFNAARLAIKPPKHFDESLIPSYITSISKYRDCLELFNQMKSDHLRIN
jgi:hypothetical protein